MSDARLDRVARVREFNRFYTNVIGILRGGYLGLPYTVAEARVIYELAQRPSAEISELRRALNLDGGYLSRIVGRLEGEALVAKERSPDDARRRIIRLTPKGRETFAVLNARSAEEIGALISSLSDEAQARLVGAMEAIMGLLTKAPRPQAYVLRDPRPGEFGWVVQRHGALYAEEYGWDATFEALVARIVADYVEHREANREHAWIAEVDGEPVGCVFCVRRTDEQAQLRLLVVEPSVRGLGIGSRLVEECVRFARRAGYKEVKLWTNDVLTDARRIYDRAGFRLEAEERHHSFGHDLVGQTLTLAL